MALILAIEPDKKQASVVRALARGVLKAQIVIADSVAPGVREIDGRIPNIVLTSLFLTPDDEAALDEYLHGLDGSGHRVPTLVIPVLAAAPRRSTSGLLDRLKKPRQAAGTEGCDPATFGAQISEYLDRAAAERALDDPDDDDPPIAAGPPAALVPSLSIDKTPDVATSVSSGAVGRILFATADVASPGVDAWDETALEAAPPENVEIAAEAIDLNAFVEQLEAVVSSYQPIVVEAEPIALPSKPIASRAEPPAVAMPLYAWRTLEGLPAGTDWDITQPGDPDYEVLAEFVEAFETPPADLTLPDAEEAQTAIAEPVPPARAVEPDGWIALSMRSRYNWPALEGAESLDAFAEIAWDTAPDFEIDSHSLPSLVQLEAIAAHAPVVEVAVETAAAPSHTVPTSPPAAQWLEILAAIRRDIQELRAEHRADLLVESDGSAEATRDTPVSTAGLAGAEGLDPIAGPAAGRSKAKKPQALPAPPARKRKQSLPPKQDEWGFFDPDQCGFAALLAKLEEVEGDEPTPPPTPERS